MSVGCRYFQAFIFVLCGSGVYVLLATLMAAGTDTTAEEEKKGGQTAAGSTGAGVDMLQPQILRLLPCHTATVCYLHL